MVFMVERPGVLAVGILFPLLGTICVGCRFAGRLRTRVKIGLEDWLIIPALVR